MTQSAESPVLMVVDRMIPEDGGLFRTMRQGKAKINGFLEDYSFFVHGLIEVHRATGDAKYLTAAGELTEGRPERVGEIELQRVPAALRHLLD